MVEEFVLMTFVYYLVAEPPPPTTKARNPHAPIKLSTRSIEAFIVIRQEHLMWTGPNVKSHW